MAEITQDTQPSTQGMIDPRRLGRNNSGVPVHDIADAICILHPCSPAAYLIVAHSAKHNPQHVLQNQDLLDSEAVDSLAPENRSDSQDGANRNSHPPTDLALRFSSRVCNPTMGFCFGRSELKCDINLDPGRDQRRVSNTHFRIYYNDRGVLMLEDSSTNGTVVDRNTLGGKNKPNTNPNSVMLSTGSVIEILAIQPADTIKFIVRIPPRDGHFEAFKANFQAYMQHVAIAKERATAAREGLPMPEAAERAVMAAPLMGPPNEKAIAVPVPQAPARASNYPMNWDGNGEYTCVGYLGKGAFATVYQVATTYSGEYYAAKELEKRRFVRNGQLDGRLDNEMKIMQELRHDNIVRLIEFHETTHHIYLIMEYIPGGDLQGYLQSHGTLSEPMGVEMSRQIFSALHYLHVRKITHRDIKPDNILIMTESPFVVKLTDFGLSKVVKNDETFMKTFCGTLLYCAPEVFPQFDNHILNQAQKRRRQQGGRGGSNRSPYSPVIDVWSYGAVLWTALTGKPPFEGVVDADGRGMLEKILTTGLWPGPLRDVGVSENAIHLLICMLEVNASARPSVVDCMEHPWVNSGEWIPHEGGNKPFPFLMPSFEKPSEGDDLDASQLSIHDKEADNEHESHHSSQSTDVPGKKRARGDYDDDVAKMSASAFQEDMAAHQPSATAPKPPKLFGEISHLDYDYASHQSNGSSSLSAKFLPGLPTERSSTNEELAASGSLLLKINADNSKEQTAHEAVPQRNSPGSARSKASLSGAESMVRELHMNSPSAGNSTIYPSGGPITPPAAASSGVLGRTENSVASDQLAQKHNSQQITPRARQININRRQINLPISATSFYDPYDPTTHNLEYASRVSGIDFLGQASESSPDLVARMEGASELPNYQTAVTMETVTVRDVSIQGTAPTSSNANALSTCEVTVGEPVTRHVVGNKDSTMVDNGTNYQEALAKLVSTSDSFMQMAIVLNRPVTTFGRANGTDYTHPDPNDIRVPKVGLELFFHAPGIDAVLDRKHRWTNLPDLHLMISTQAHNGIWVNGVHMAMQNGEGRRLYGRLCDGDVVEVCRPPSGQAQTGDRLKFDVHIMSETARVFRRAGEPRFEVCISTS